MNNIRCETNRHFMNKKRGYSKKMKKKMNELAKNSKNKNIKDHHRGINEFKVGYQHRSNLLKDEFGDLLDLLLSVIEST
jgi:hypothetical protein